MRGLVAELGSPHPLSETLPSMLREDPFARSLCESFDDVLAPVLLTLDTFGCYLDPTTTPEDMIPWLAQWLGLGVDLNVEQARQRHELQIAGSLNVTRGTQRAPPDSETATRMPGDPDATLSVVVHPDPGVEVDLDRLGALVRSVKPAHVRHVVTVQPGEQFVSNAGNTVGPGYATS